MSIYQVTPNTSRVVGRGTRGKRNSVRVGLGLGVILAGTVLVIWPAMERFQDASDRAH
jgi:hypothetical protein